MIVKHGLFEKEEKSEAILSDWSLFPTLVPQEDIWFAIRDGKKMATATGMLESEGIGYLHYICAIPEARGTGIATALLRKVIENLTERGASYIYLTTDDFRLGAIKTYLRLGLTPLIEDEEERTRWTAVLNKLGM